MYFMYLWYIEFIFAYFLSFVIVYMIVYDYIMYIIILFQDKNAIVYLNNFPRMSYFT